LLRRSPASAFHRAALGIALGVGGVAALLQPLSGDLSARQVAETQPLKLAAMEGHFETRRGAPLLVGGIVDAEARETRFALEIPYGLSLLAFHDPHAEVKGLLAFPRDTWPDTFRVHLAFDVMVGLGTVLALVSLAGAVLAWRSRGVPAQRRYLSAVVAAGPLGFVALEAGWLVTEWGRQPFVIHGVMRTADAVTPVGNLAVPFAGFMLLYLFLALMVGILLWRQIAHGVDGPDEPRARAAP
jgi:cytochrome d ubiquinol oxidase subunit I